MTTSSYTLDSNGTTTYDRSTVSYRYDADGTLLREDRTIYIQTQFGPIEQIGRTAYSGGVTYQLALAGEPAERIDFEGGFITLPDGGYHFHVRDHLGSTRAVVALGGALERTLDYGPYGESLGTALCVDFEFGRVARYNFYRLRGLSIRPVCPKD